MAKSLIANPTTQNGMDYVKSLENLLNTKKKDLLKRQQTEIIKIYQRAYVDTISKGLKKAGNDPKKIDKLTKAYATQIYNELNDLVVKYNNKISKDIVQTQGDIINAFLDTKDKEFIAQVDKLVDITNRQIVQQMVRGDIYHDGKGLSDRIWDTAKTSGTKLSTAINSCIAQGMGAAEISQNLKEFAMGGHHTWSRNKIKEKLGPGYARRYSGGLDYEALRLARTTITHQAQLAVINSNKVNPYSQFIKWHSDHQAGRTCQQCIDRDGQIFPIDKVPLDHPNGGCWIQPVFSIDGKTEATPEQIAQDMKNWGQGKKNSGLMDTIPEYKGLGGKDKKTVKPKAKKAAKPKAKEEPKVTDKPKVKDKVDDYLQQYIDSRKQGKVPTDLIEKAKEQIAKTIKGNKAQLEKDYKYVTEKDVKKHHKLRGIADKSKMSREDQFAYDLYVQKMDSFAMNRRLYTGEYGKKKGRRVHPRDEQIDKFTALVAKDKLDDNSRFVRFVDADYLQSMYKQLGLGEGPTKNAINRGNGILDLNVDLMNKVITHEAFTSVSFNQYANVFTNKPVMMEIYADKGLECLYTFNYKESEVVLQRGTQFKIKGIEVVEDYDKWHKKISYIKIIAQAVSKK